MPNKKGISDTVSLVLILLLAISLIGFLSYFLIGMMRDIDLSPEFFECDKIRTNINIVESCYNNQTNELEIKMSNSYKKNINKIYFILNLQEQTKLWTCYDNCGTCKPLQSGEKTYFIITEKPELIEILVDDCKVIEKKIDFC